ncbi:MAG TPA: hypothetical protein VFA48_09135 [Gammaproteobacteria bacterium]|nr:hypothetical protein [Gammaproteobacteria bacterium]
METVVGRNGVQAPENNLGVRHVPIWIAQTFGLWRMSPFKYTVLSLTPLVAEGLLQLVPEAGVLISKIIVPLVGAGILLGVDQLARSGKLSWGCVFAGFTYRRLGGLFLVSAVTSLTVFATQIGVASWFYGGARVWDAVVLGHMHQHPALLTPVFTEALILPGMLPATLFTLVIPFFLFEDLGVLSCFGLGIRRLLSAWLLFVTFLILNVLIFGVALLGGPSVLLLLVVVPLSTLFTYVVYRAMVGRPL